MRLSPTRSWWCVLPFLLAHSGKFLLLHSKLSVGNSNTLFMLRIDFSWNVLVGSLMLLSGFSFRTSSRLLSWVSLVLSKTLSMLRSELPPGTSWHPLGPNTLLNTAARSCRYALDANTPFMLRSELSLGTSTLSWCYALTLLETVQHTLLTRRSTTVLMLRSQLPLGLSNTFLMLGSY